MGTLGSVGYVSNRSQAVHQAVQKELILLLSTLCLIRQRDNIVRPSMHQ